MHVGQNFIQAKEYELGLLDNSLVKLDPQAVLRRGFAKIEQKGKSVDKAMTVDLKSNINIYMDDGKIIATPIEILEGK